MLGRRHLVWPPLFLSKFGTLLVRLCCHFCKYSSDIVLFLKDIQSSYLDFGCVVFKSVKIIPHCFNVKDKTWLLVFHCFVFVFFSNHVCFYCTVSVFQMIVILKNEAVAKKILFRWHWMVDQNLLKMSKLQLMSKLKLCITLKIGQHMAQERLKFTAKSGFLE